MRRILFVTAAGAPAVVPAVLGLTGNPALSHQVPVRNPANVVPVSTQDLAARVDDRPLADDHRPALSERERQVLRLVSRGMANKQAGRALGISERTVKVHLGNVFRQIGVSDRTSAALWARTNLPEAPQDHPDAAVRGRSSDLTVA